MKRPVYDRLLQFQQEDRYPFHMPGHKRQLENDISSRMFGWDITEIDGFDELHDPSGIILESMEEIQDFYQTKKSWYLVNGSSCGNLAAVGAAFYRGDSILLARNCHKSVYHGIELFGLHPFYLYPEIQKETGIYGAVTARMVEEELKKHREIKGVFLTSPTYEGVVSDIGSIRQVCEKYGAVLIVDEAHGAHFAFSDYFPDSAVTMGADVVIQSLHKTMAVPNQGALLHLCSDRVSKERLNRFQSMFQTTSPSYVLLASMEYGIVHGRQKKDFWKKYERLLEQYRNKWEKLSFFHLLSQKDFPGEQCYDYDRGKLVFLVKGRMTGKEAVKKLLEKYHLQMEMSEKHYWIAMTSYLDTEEAFCRLDHALREMEKEIETEGQLNRLFQLEAPRCEIMMTPEEAGNQNKILVQKEESVGKIAGDYVYLYPPGSPILVPGEKINTKVLEKIEEYLYNGMEVKGFKKNRLCIIDEKRGECDVTV